MKDLRKYSGCACCENGSNCNLLNITTKFTGRCIRNNRKYYAHKDDISAMVEWAEERYRNEGGEVVCDRYEDSLCATTCPRSLCNFDRYQKWFKFECLDEPDKECRFIAYRGNPEAKEEAPEKDEVNMSENVAADGRTIDQKINELLIGVAGRNVLFGDDNTITQLVKSVKYLTTQLAITGNQADIGVTGILEISYDILRGK